MNNFIRNKESSLANLGVGKVHLIKSWLDEMNVKNYIINDNLTIDVKGDVNLYDRDLIKLPDYIKFNKVECWFNCSENQLTSLEGCPNYTGLSFTCSNNQLTSLEGCPTYVGTDFSCSYNNLNSLKCCPYYVGTDFWCYNNKKLFTKEEVKKLCEVKRTIYV